MAAKRSVRQRLKEGYKNLKKKVKKKVQKKLSNALPIQKTIREHNKEIDISKYLR